MVHYQITDEAEARVEKVMDKVLTQSKTESFDDQKDLLNDTPTRRDSNTC